MNSILYADMKRNSGQGMVYRFLYVLRIAQGANNKFVKLICRLILRIYRTKYGL